MADKSSPDLFGEFYYGMPRQEVAAKIPVAPCVGDLASPLSLCSGQVEFIGLNWLRAFWFNNSDELQQVMLLNEKGPDAFATATEGLSGLGWLPALLEAESSAFDVLHEIANAGTDAAQKAMSEYLKAALGRGEDFAIYYFPEAYYKNVAGKITAFSIAVDNAPEDFVLIRLVVSETWLKLFFTAPLLSRKNALRYGQYIKRG